VGGVSVLEERCVNPSLLGNCTFFFALRTMGFGIYAMSVFLFLAW